MQQMQKGYTEVSSWILRKTSGIYVQYGVDNVEVLVSDGEVSTKCSAV